MRFVAGGGVAEIDDKHVGFDLDDAGDEVFKRVYQHRLDLDARFGAGNAPELLLEHGSDEDRTVATHGDVLEKVLFRKVGVPLATEQIWSLAAHARRAARTGFGAPALC
jgi:hypothetical protein